MMSNQRNQPAEFSFPETSDPLPLILLSGDNARSALVLRHALVSHGFNVRFAASYDELEVLWQQQRHSVVLLEVSGEHGIEAAVDTALQLKRNDPRQFVGYLADPPLHSSGLAGDAIFPRAAEQLAHALRRHFAPEQSAQNAGDRSTEGQ